MQGERRPAVIVLKSRWVRKTREVKGMRRRVRLIVTFGVAELVPQKLKGDLALDARDFAFFQDDSRDGLLVTFSRKIYPSFDGDRGPATRVERFAVGLADFGEYFTFAHAFTNEFSFGRIGSNGKGRYENEQQGGNNGFHHWLPKGINYARVTGYGNA